MCLYIDKLFHQRIDNILQPLIAKTDKTVWKVIGKHNLSMHRKKHYSPNKLYQRVAFGYSSDSLNIQYIEAGYHAFTSRCIARLKYYSNKEEYKLVKFTIPKGAKYYIGEDGDIVSNMIKSGNLIHCR